MKKSVFHIIVALTLFVSCKNQDQNLNADVEIPVSVEDIRLKSIEEFVNTTGTTFPKGEIEMKTKIILVLILIKNLGGIEKELLNIIAFLIVN